MNTAYKYFAFISYNSKDTSWGKKLQRKLEHYRMPATLCSEHNWKSNTPIRPVFFAPTDIQPGGLSDELKQRLKASRHLIVICSPNSAQSEWVGKEIAYFHSLGRTKNIHSFIVDGVPHSGNPETECFNPIIKELGIPEILGVNIHEKVSAFPWINKERAYVQLITKLLGVEFDALWQRHKRLLFQQVVATIIGVIAVIAALIGVWCYTQPIDVRLQLNEATVHNNNLSAMKDAIVTLSINNETKSDTLTTINSEALFANIPSHAIGKEAHIRVTCENWLTTDTIVVLAQALFINVRRDPHPYGDVQFILWNPVKESACSGIKASIEGIEGISDAEGRVCLTIPLEKQRQQYVVSCEIPLRDSILDGRTTTSTALLVK